MSSSELARRARRVLIVDDSELMRRMLGSLVAQLGDFDVVGEAATGYQAIRMVHELEPDIVTLDLQMPDLGGLDTLGYIMSETPRPVIIVSSQTETMAEPGLQALLSGAVEFVPKAAAESGASMARFRLQFAQALRAAAIAHLLNMPERMLMARRKLPRATARPARAAIAIAASTGGPRALTEVVPQLPVDLGAAVFIVQHMPPLFTAALARRLDEVSFMAVREAVSGAPVEEGVVYVAPGGRHMDVERAADGIRIRLHDAPPVWGVRPAADVLFPAVARTYGPASIGVVLTGMGRDGADGLRMIREVGGSTLAQDEESCVIPSMPRAAAEHAAAVVRLQDIAARLVESVAMRQRLTGS